MSMLTVALPLFTIHWAGSVLAFAVYLLFKVSDKQMQRRFQFQSLQMQLLNQISFVNQMLVLTIIFKGWSSVVFFPPLFSSFSPVHLSVLELVSFQFVRQDVTSSSKEIYLSARCCNLNCAKLCD